MPIGDKLDALLKLRNRNVNELSIKTGVTASTIYSIIRRNNMKVDLDDLQAIADELSVNLDYFVSDDVKAMKVPESEAKLASAIDVEGKELVDIINQMKPEERQKLLDYLKAR